MSGRGGRSCSWRWDSPIAAGASCAAAARPRVSTARECGARVMKFGDHTVAGFLMAVGGSFGLRHGLRLITVAKQVGLTPIASPAQVSSGVVRVRGRIRSMSPVVSPFTQTPCCWYRVEVAKPATASESQGAGWWPLHGESSTAEFAIEGDGVSLRVRPPGLDFDMPYNFEEEVISKPTGQHQRVLVDFVAQHVPDGLNRFVFDTAQAALLSPERAADPRVAAAMRGYREQKHRQLHQKTTGKAFRFREICLIAGQECEVAGTLTVENGIPVLHKGVDGTPFLVSTKLGAELHKSQRRQALKFVAVSGAVFFCGVSLLVFPD